MGKINIKNISSNFQKDCKGDKCLICNNKLNYNNGKVLNLYKSNTTVSITCKRCGAVHTAKYEMKHNKEDTYTKVHMNEGIMNIEIFSKYSDDIIADYYVYCRSINATISDEEGE
jgi:transcription elongation factor Elf1